MHQLAEAGVAAHWLYKADGETASALQIKTLDWLKSLLDIQHGRVADTRGWLHRVA